MLNVEVNNQQTVHTIDNNLVRRAVEVVLLGENVSDAEISVGIVDDETIHRLNQRYLEHDYATDVLSFLLDDGSSVLDGEVIVSADTAARSCLDFGWSATDELTLYIIHGTLHLVGYDDQDERSREEMRSRERLYLAELGLVQPANRTATNPAQRDDDQRRAKELL